MDFLDSLLMYIESLNACQPLTNTEFVAFVLQTRTTIENAKKQLNIERKKAIKRWFGRNKGRRQKALSAFDRSREDADALYNMRDILNEM